MKATTEDDDVLAVLRTWYFGRNRIRTHVFPEGATSVQSDTMGLVRARDGRVMLSGMTTKHRDVFKLLCRWINGQLPSAYTRPFAFTSISMNFAYAAKRHRDGNNVGPSMTKAFGSFAGGQLLYWPADDGMYTVEQQSDHAAMHIDTQRSMVLVDGHRCHSVAPFTGERYSLVYFTITEAEKAGKMTLDFLIGAGAAFPTMDAKRYWAHLVSPPRGESRSIRRMFGYSEKPAAIQCGGTPLGRIGDAIHKILSYAATPMAMPMLCVVAHFVYSACWRQEAWAGVVVDTRRIRPAGRKANSLWQKWIAAKAVISGAWAAHNVGVIVSPRVAVWRWGTTSPARWAVCSCVSRHRALVDHDVARVHKWVCSHLPFSYERPSTDCE